MPAGKIYHTIVYGLNAMGSSCITAYTNRTLEGSDVCSTITKNKIRKAD
jgi:hypothetical protein